MYSDPKRFQGCKVFVRKDIIVYSTINLNDNVMVIAVPIHRASLSVERQMHYGIYPHDFVSIIQHTKKNSCYVWLLNLFEKMKGQDDMNAITIAIASNFQGHSFFHFTAEKSKVDNLKTAVKALKKSFTSERPGIKDFILRSQCADSSSALFAVSYDGTEGAKLGCSKSHANISKKNPQNAFEKGGVLYIDLSVDWESYNKTGEFICPGCKKRYVLWRYASLCTKKCERAKIDMWPYMNACGAGLIQ